MQVCELYAPPGPVASFFPPHSLFLLLPPLFQCCCYSSSPRFSSSHKRTHTHTHTLAAGEAKKSVGHVETLQLSLNQCAKDKQAWLSVS